MAIPLREFRRLQPIQTPRRQIPMEQIIRVMGKSPAAEGMRVTGETVGKALQTTGDIIGQALAKKAELRKQGEQLAALERISGQGEGAYAGLSPSMASSMASSQMKIKMDREAAELKKAEDLKRISLFEKRLGLKPGELGDDYDAAKVAFNQASISGRQLTNPYLEIAEKRQEISEGNAFKNRVNNQKNRMVNDPRVKPLHQQGINLGQISEIATIAKAGNTVAAASLGVKMARGMGEVGVLTESDITRYVTSGRLDRKAADKLSLWLKGRPTEATIDEIDQITKVLRDSFAEKIQPTYNEYIESFAEVEGMSPDDVSKKMGIPYKPMLKPLPAKGTETPDQRKARLLKELSGAK